MKIFIIYASAGFGHQKIAESINETAISLYGKNNITLLDVLDFTPHLFKFMYSKGYIFLISKIRWLWAIIFFLSNTKYLKLINYNFRRFSNRMFCYSFFNFIKKEHPDTIISTHFLVNELISFLKEKKQIKTKLISVVTDFGVHNFWLAKNIDTYVAACKRTKEILISKHVNKQKIRVLGVPIRKEFQRQIDRNAIRKKLGLQSEGFTTLILTGGIGIGPIFQIVKLLIDKINVIVICGNNKKLYYHLKKLNYGNLVVFGWIDYVEEAMAASDIAITKPGGSTISECLAMNLPMIFFSIIPGQEYQNAQIISKYGLGFILNKPRDIKEKVLYLKDNPQETSVIKERINSFKVQFSSRKVLDLINEQ